MCMLNLYPVPQKFVDVFFKYQWFAGTYKRNEKCFGNNKNVLFLNLNDKIIEQEINKMAIHTHVSFRPRNATWNSYRV